MGAADHAAAHMDGGDHDALGLQKGERVAHACHVGHRVQGPHLVEVDLVHRAAVGPGLGCGKPVVDAHCPVPHRLGQGQGGDVAPDIGQSRVVVAPMAVVMRMPRPLVGMGVVGMPLVMALLLFPADRHSHMRACDATGGRRLGLHCHAGQPQAVHGAEEARLIVQQFIERRHQHVPGRPHVALQIQSLHDFPSLPVVSRPSGPPSD